MSRPSTIQRFYFGTRANARGPDLAQASYTLGVVETRSLERVWPATKVELHFEAAFQSAPWVHLR